MIPNYHWDFPVDAHTSNQVVRKTRMQEMLDEVRVIRDVERISVGRLIHLVISRSLNISPISQRTPLGLSETSSFACSFYQSSIS